MKVVIDNPLTGSRHQGLLRVETEDAVGNPRLILEPREFVNPELLDNISGVETYVVRQGDSVLVLAAELLGDTRLWWLIAELNPEAVPDPQRLVPGTVIRVPPLEVVQRLL